MKRIIPYIPFVVLLIISIVSLNFSESKRNATICKDVIFKIDEGKTKTPFLKEIDILNSIKISKKSLVGKKINSIRVYDIEDKIENNPSVLACQCYFTTEGNLIVEVSQRIPIVRILAMQDNYYIDQHGRLMPLSKNFSARSVVASGNISEGFRKKHNVLLEQTKDSSCLKDIYELALAIREDSFLNALIEQIYVTDSKEYLLISKIGPTKIEFGSIEFYEEKLKNLKAFYKSRKVRENWHLYESISVKYRNQIVCTKY